MEHWKLVEIALPRTESVADAVILLLFYFKNFDLERQLCQPHLKTWYPDALL